MHAIPLLDQVQEVDKLLTDLGRNLHAQRRDTVLKLLCNTHAIFFASEKPRFKCTSNNEMAAGVMPEMRAA